MISDGDRIAVGVSVQASPETVYEYGLVCRSYKTESKNCTVTDPDGNVISVRNNQYFIPEKAGVYTIVYSDKTVEFPSEVDCSKAFFNIIVRLEDGTVAYKIPFKCQYEAEGINISGNTGYFGGGFSEDCDFNS